MVKYTLEALRESPRFSPQEKDLMAGFAPGAYTLAEMEDMLAREKERVV